MAATKKIQTNLWLEPEQRAALVKLHKATRIPQQVLMREGIDMMLTKYKRKGVI